MRRSLAPSQTKVYSTPACGKPISCDNQKKKTSNDDEITIQRMPMFNFLEIPETLHRQFKVPTGCVITEKTLELRKIKRLGPPKQFRIVQPGDFANGLFKKALVTPLQVNDGEDEDADLDELPSNINNLPPFEPLVLWKDTTTGHKVEVIAELASKLRPHQREGVQFLFECTMGLRGFEGFGCILADDMGLGKTLMSITLLWTLLNQNILYTNMVKDYFAIDNDTSNAADDTTNDENSDPSHTPSNDNPTTTTPANKSSNKLPSAVKKVMIVCPTSLVGNWDNELRKWIGEKFLSTVAVFAVKSEPKKIIKQYLMHRGKAILIVSYETQRLYSKLFESALKPSFGTKSNKVDASDSANKENSKMLDYSCCGDLMICDEAHKLKNAESELSKSLALLPIKRKILLSGTPMQNELGEFFNMVNFCNPNVIGTISEFRRRYERPILAAREPDALDREVKEAQALQKQLSTIVNEFILKRGNILNAQHLPPKLVQYVCCRLTPLQESLYLRLLSSKEIRHIQEGKELNTLNSIRQLINICSHPKLILDNYQRKLANKEPIDEDLQALADIIINYNNANPTSSNTMKTNSTTTNKISSLMRKPMASSATPQNKNRIDVETSGKLTVLFRMLHTIRALNTGERIVIVSNYTQTLDLIEELCQQFNYHVLRLDGTITAVKRTKLVEEFNDLKSKAFVFLLSSKAGGCGINLIGGNRLVLFDPDWNPASDKQAAGRIWREGQRRRCFIYRFMSTGTIEEKIIQRQLSKEGLADIVDDKEQLNSFSTEELKQLFHYSTRADTLSDTHDKLKCSRCIHYLSKTTNSSSNNSSSSKKQTRFSEVQKVACIEFLESFLRLLYNESTAYQQREIMRHTTDTTTTTSEVVDIQSVAFIQERVDRLKAMLSGPQCETLTSYSRKQRECFQQIEQEYLEYLTATPTTNTTTTDETTTTTTTTPNTPHTVLFPPTYSIYNTFLQRWTETVPTLIALKPTPMILDKTHNNEDTTSNTPPSTNTTTTTTTTSLTECFSEQIGCPEDTALASYGHHVSTLTIDDELLTQAFAEDYSAGVDSLYSTVPPSAVPTSSIDYPLISFVFSCEVNFTLLQQREAEQREAVLERKAQQQRDLLLLNQQRQLAKNKSGGETVGGDEEADEELLDVNGSGNGKKKKKGSAGGESKKRKVKEVVDHDNDDDHDGGDASGASKRGRKKKDNTTSDVTAVVAVTADVVAGSSGDGDGSSSSSARKKKRVNFEDSEELPTPSQSEPQALSSSERSRERRSATTTVDSLSTITSSSITSANTNTSKIDHLFTSDWQRIKKLLTKQLSSLANTTTTPVMLSSFISMWKTIKHVNNSWRMLLHEDTQIMIFTRTQGLNLDNLDSPKYSQGIDYFIGEEELLMFIIKQAKYHGDTDLCRLIKETLLLHSAPSSSSATTNEDYFDTSNKTEEISLVSPTHTTNTSTSTIDVMNDDGETKTTTATTTIKKKRKVVLLSDDEDE